MVRFCGRLHDATMRLKFGGLAILRMRKQGESEKVKPPLVRFDDAEINGSLGMRALIFKNHLKSKRTHDEEPYENHGHRNRLFSWEEHKNINCSFKINRHSKSHHRSRVVCRLVLLVACIACKR